MRLSLRQLQIFIAVADTGSTSAAGQRIALSQSATSGALNELEALLGAQLFDRVGKRLLLNDNGRTLLPRSRELLDAAQEIESLFDPDAARLLSSRLRLGASTTIGNYLLPALVAGFEREWPAAAVDMVIDNTRGIAALVARLEVDLGLIEGPCPEPTLKVLAWREDELVIVSAADHALAAEAARAPLSLDALRSARWLQREPGSGTREAVEQALLPHLHHLGSSLQLGSTEAIKQAAAQGMGLACLSRAAVEDLVTLGRLAVLRTALPRLGRRLYLICHPQKRFSAALQRFLAHIELGV
ncbi:LysR family transcriptional regulator [Xylophilus rhododendri]|uniref:LysR family transcriptional regulator n=1 Tax=Xylophilus rhododendri TaxID=2697032 RepID=A0A857JCT1_9BURK|nr:LysR family transcriptional regulator [Xylophilus rhododendri]QHJ01012.1 LysR family transcriptional regulator [Xylophilus rhododendri]